MSTENMQNQMANDEKLTQEIKNDLYISQKNGFLEILTKEEYENINKIFFKTCTKDKGIFFVNEDTKNIIPYIKDILNRKHDFLEIRLLKIIFIFVSFIMLLNIIVLYFSFNINSKYTQQQGSIEQINGGIDGLQKTIQTNKPL